MAECRGALSRVLRKRLRCTTRAAFEMGMRREGLHVPVGAGRWRVASAGMCGDGVGGGGGGAE